MGRPRFRLLPHTADARLCVWGADDRELIEHAVAGTVRVALGSAAALAPREVAPIDPWPDELAHRLVRAANEALFQLYARGMVATGVDLRGKLAGLRLAPLPAGRRPAREIKAVTYHALRLAARGPRRRAILTLDL